MGWFDEQIRQRRESDNAVFEDSFLNMAGAVMGRRMSEALNDDRQLAEDAIGEILKFYHVKPQEVPEAITDMNEVLEYLLRPSGIMRRNVNLDRGWYRDAVGAMLGTRTDDGTLVALIPAGLNGYSFLDRSTGKRVKLTKRTERLIAREAVAFYKPFPLKKMSMGSLFRYILEQISPRDAILVALAMLSVTLVGMLTPKLNQMLFSEVLDSGSTTVLLGMALFMVCASVSALMLGTARSMITARVGTKLNLSVEAATMMRLLSLPPDFFKSYSAGELSNRSQYLNTLASQMVSVAMSTGLTSVFSLLYLAQVFVYAPALVAPALLITLLTLVVTTVQVFARMKISKQQMELGSKESGMSYQLISGIQKIRLSGAEKRAFARWGKLFGKSAELAYNPPMFLKIGSVLTLAISLIGTMVMYYAAIRSGVSVAEYYAFNAAYGMVNGAFMSLAGIASTIAAIKPVLEMARPIMETVPEVAEDKLVLTRISGGVELNNVTFRYTEDMPPVLDDLSLKIRPGQYVAIVGKTGCGKSTLMRIMLGFETPQKGAVYYDGRDLKKIDLKSLRRKIGAVMQNGRMFTGDIFSNITISAPWLTLDDAWAAAEIAGLADDIRDMPMGMNTLISEGQGGISGGQRQRLLIARAVAPKPKILMFDEATSALDNLTQKQVSEALDKMKCTRIVIAHRLSTIRRCDRIIVLDKGKIIEDGSYDELLAKDGYFADLVARQRLDDVGYVGKTTAF
ncbi:MAG: NHLP bacteriocin export ABC transporter permease/ATPase subunit [Oscillospiraceae bacterium]|nr:NHLP bacteriocin export ABC transporter permease/ATPase subunit [Oscillospiraceae bacterium]